MTEPAPVGYRIGNVGEGAQVAQGSNINQTMLQAGVSPEQIRAAFADVFSAIAADETLDQDEKQVAKESAEEVMTATEQAGDDPGALKRALGKAKKLLGGAWTTLVKAMESDAVQKTIGTITEASMQATIKSMLG